MTFEYKQFHRRKLPHIHSPGATLFVTFRLKGSVPKKVIESWKAEKASIEAARSRVTDDSKHTVPLDPQQKKKLDDYYRRWFARYEEILHKAVSGPVWLREPAIAQIVTDSFHHLDEKSYNLHAYCIMPNHAHSLFSPLLGDASLTEVKKSGRRMLFSEHPTTSAIMQSIKGYSAREANRLLDRKGQFWEPESYDHQVRDQDEFWRIVRYILRNPVKAGLVNEWSDWPFSWVAPELGYSSLTDSVG